jgi:phosphate starvation-inducible protein PhoH and related proteins
VPHEYLWNAPRVRLAMLQGLLDAGGRPVTGSDGACRIECSARSSELVDDIVFLVQSLGGTARLAHSDLEGGEPHRVDIRLPQGIEPFRAAPLRRRYDAAAGGQPRRFIDAIEPSGDAETVCIQVGAQDSLYVTDDFLVTHNTLNSSFIILDEAQNTTPEQMKMFLTRIGFGSKAVVTGDTTQVDVPGGRSGLGGLERILSEIDGISFVHLGSRDVVRHRIVQDIVDAYERAQGPGEAPRT